jgi:FkbH-like protein
VAGLYEELRWLPRAPEDFRRRCRELRNGTRELGRAVQALASHALDIDQLTSLGRTLDNFRVEGRSIHPLIPFRLGLIGNGTLDLTAPALVASAARHGFALECICGDFDQTLQEAVTPASRINAARTDAVLIALDYRGLPLKLELGSIGGSGATVKQALQHLETICSGIRNYGRSLPIVQTIAPPPESLFGSLDRVTPGTLYHVIDQINRGIAEQTTSSPDLLLDVARLAEIIGIASWHDPTLWDMAKVPFSTAYLPLYADHVARLLVALRGKSRRCLVLDLDNTVWGGVIGDDGMEGIRLAQGDAIGEGYLSVQRFALALRDRGVILAVSSKNDDAVARQVFREHPDMLLREDHIAVFQANWNDKATNIRAIADELSIGLDAFVLLDDNPVERELVRRTIPEVGVPELPDDPALYARTLAAAGYFDAITFSDEDRNRANFYQANARRVSVKSQAGDLDAFLASLDMEITFQPFDATMRARITQLINKSNQFNLTTRRYTEAEVAATEADRGCFTLQARLTDTFGDNGMISVVICREKKPQIWMIDTWLMSCRVLGRGVEQAVLHEILHHARSNGIVELVGIYRSTERNGMVRDHFPKLGFVEAPDRLEGADVWLLRTDAKVDVPNLRIRRFGFTARADG